MTSVVEPSRGGGPDDDAIAFVLSLFLKEIPLSDVSGMVARGEAISGEEAERRALLLIPFGQVSVPLVRPWHQRRSKTRRVAVGDGG